MRTYNVWISLEVEDGDEFISLNEVLVKAMATPNLQEALDFMESHALPGYGVPSAEDVSNEIVWMKGDS